MGDQPQGTGAPEASQGNETPKGLSSEDMNRAITARFKAFESKLDKMFEEKLSAFAPKSEQHQETQQQSQQSQGGAPKLEELPEFRALAKKTEKLQELLSQAQKERDAEKAHARDVKLRTELAQHLAEAGIEGSRAKHAVGFLIDAEKRAFWEGDAIAFKDANGDPLPLSEGVKSWLSSEDAKLYLPPRGAAGSGERQSSSNRLNAPADARSNALELLGQRYGLSG